MEWRSFAGSMVLMSGFQAIGLAKGEGIVSRVSNGLELCARQGGAGKTGMGVRTGTVRSRGLVKLQCYASGEGGKAGDGLGMRYGYKGVEGWQ
jgi:hypothetical protein